MRLLTPEDVPLDEIRQTVKAGALGNLVGAGLCAAVPVAWGVGLWRNSWSLWRLENVVLIPVMLLVTLLCVVLAVALWHSFRMSLGPGNWLARFGRDEVYLNLRSYHNSHFAPAPDTVVQISYADIESATPMAETYRWSENKGKRHRMRSRRSLELVVRAQTEALDTAIRIEREREAPNTGTESKRSSIKSHDLPIYLAGPGRVRVQAYRGLSEAFAEHVRLEPLRKLDLNEQLESSSEEERTAILHDRGWRRIKAA